MKKKIRSVICIMIASMVVLSACGSQSTGSNNISTEGGTIAENKENEKNTASSEGVFDENGVSAEGQFPITEEQIELTVMVPSLSLIHISEPTRP